MKKVIIIIALAAIVTEAAIAGTITGVVTSDSNGLPIANIWVEAVNYETGNWCGGDNTHSNGVYEIINLATGTYRVRASGGSQYTSEFYNNQLSWDSATPVNVSAGQQTTGIDFSLGPGASISGVVKNSAGVGQANIQVNCWADDGYGTGTQTEANGFYECGGLPVGYNYNVVAYPPPDSNYMITRISVGVYQPREYTGNDIVFGEGGLKISGRVTDKATTLPLADIRVGYWNDDLEIWAETRTDANGMYRLTNLPPGEVEVSAEPESYYAGISIRLELTQNIDNLNFSLELGASISGVVKNSAGVGQANIQVNCWADIDNGYGTGTQTEANGFYECGGLPVGYNYNVVAYPPPDSNYMITRISVGVYQPREYTGKDIVLGEGGLKISGKVTDKATTLPLADVRVGLWNDDFEIWTDTRTDVNGMYLLTNLPPGEEVDISIEPESYYAYMGIEEFKLEGDINNLDFALPAGAILCGKVLDADTAEPLAGVEIEYDSERYNAEQNTFTDADGTFCLTQLPPGIGEVKAEPDVDSGYAWNLPWASDLVCLGEGENRSERIIALEKGALVRGYIKDANGNALSGIEYYYSGRDCDGWGDTDVNGFYQIRLPAGTYSIAPDEEELGTLPEIVTITDVNKDINVPDIIFYTEGNGGQISGEVNNPSGYAKTGCFLIIAFEAGTTLSDPNTWYTIQPVSETEMENAGPFSLAKLPPDANYDIYLCVYTETPDKIISLAVRDSALNVAAGTTGIMLEYSSQGSTVRGSVKNTDDRAVLGAEVLLADSSNGFGGFGETDCNGQYVIHNIPAGTYTVTAVHSKYLNTLTTVEVADGILVDVNTIFMPFAGEKEGADLNGDGVIDMLDVAEFCETWLESDSSEADFNQDSRVNFNDWARMAENWLSKAIWYQE